LYSILRKIAIGYEGNCVEFRMISRNFVNVRFLLYGAASYRSEQAIIRIILIVLLNLRTTDGRRVNQTKKYY